eukprot:COSAG02_NODE_1509_length_12226_cov_6.533850_4_plen_595_part_00
MGAGNSACSSRWARCHENMVARGNRVKNVATVYHRQPSNAIGSATLRGLVHEFTFTWVKENVQLTEERMARREAERIRDEEREELIADKREAKKEARKQAKLAEKQRDAERDQRLRALETTDAAELALMAADEEPEPELDPESEYSEPTQQVELQRPPSPRCGGPDFGIELTPDCVVASLQFDCWAKREGVQVGSRILEINGEAVATKEEAESLFRNTEPGSTVTVLLATDAMSEVSTDSEIDFERKETDRCTRESNERMHDRINFAVGLCESEFDVEEWARNSDKAWYLGGNAFIKQYGEYVGQASLYAKGVRGHDVKPVLGAGATIRIIVDLRPDHGRATFWMMPEKGGLEEEVGVIEGLPLRKVPLHPFISLVDPGDVWELSELTRRYDIEGDWIQRAGFQECKAELASRGVDSEGVFEDQLESLRQMLREAVARENAEKKAREHQAELEAKNVAAQEEAMRLEQEQAAKEQAARDAVDPNLVGCKTDGTVRVFVTGFGEGVYHQFHKPSRWAKDKTTMHTIIINTGEEVTKPWSDCRLVESSDSEGSDSDVSSDGLDESGGEGEPQARNEATGGLGEGEVVHEHGNPDSG